MPKIATDYNPANLDLTRTVKPWQVDPNGTYQRQPNRAAAMQAVVDATNRLLARLPRVVFGKAQPLGQVDATGSNPLYVWRYRDGVHNARTQNARLVIARRTSAGSGDAYAERQGGAATERTIVDTAAVVTALAHEDAAYASYLVSRGAPANASTNEGVSTYNGYPVLDICVQDTELVSLDTTVHRLVNAANVKPGGRILFGPLEQVRRELDHIRTENLPIVLSWVAQYSGGSLATPGSTNHTGVAITSTSFENIADSSVSIRSATSPGISCHVRYGGYGPSWTTEGARIRVVGSILAGVPAGTADGTVRIHGPNFTAGGGASNYQDVTISSGAAAWYDFTSPVYLDPTVSDSDTTTGRNKIDILGRVESGGTGAEVLYIYGVRGWEVTP